MLAHSELTFVVTFNVFALSLGQKLPQKNTPTSLDTLESKDVLLQMLEKKLKEIKDNKKLKNGDSAFLPKNVDLNLKSNGISSVGNSELLLRYGKNGQGTVNLTADGISNVGKVQVVVGSGDNGLNIPGLGNLFVGPASIRSDIREDKTDLNLLQSVNSNDIAFGFRRQTNIAYNDVDKVNNLAIEVIAAKKDVPKVEAADNLAVGNTDGVNAVSTDMGDSSTINMNAAVTSSQAVAMVASISPVISSGPAIKSDIVSVNAVASKVENVNKVK